MQGHPTQSGPFEMAMIDRNMQFEFSLKIVLKTRDDKFF